MKVRSITLHYETAQIDGGYVAFSTIYVIDSADCRHEAAVAIPVYKDRDQSAIVILQRSPQTDELYRVQVSDIINDYYRDLPARIVEHDCKMLAYREARLYAQYGWRQREEWKAEKPVWTPLAMR